MIQRLVRWWWSLWAETVALARIGPGELSPGPVPAPVSAPELLVEAQSMGTRDGSARIYDAWSFGGPGDARSAAYEPQSVKTLRERCQVHVEGLHRRQLQTEGRIAPLHARGAQARRNMQGARDRMSVLATAEARENEPDLDRNQELQGAAAEPAAAVAATGAQPEGARIPWEGESTPLHMFWRCLILAGLAAAQLPLQLTTFGYLLGSTSSAGRVYWLAIAVSLVVALGPFLAGVQLRARKATGADRRIGLVVIVLVVAWLAAAVVLGLVGGRAYQERHAMNAGQHPSTVTLVVMFSALLLVIGAMALMLGLAGHHPTQRVHVRERQIGERAEIMASRAAVRLNPDYQPPGPDGLEVSLEAAEREITATYESAIEGYYAALCQAMADPAFTEAVQARRVEAAATGD